MTVYIQCLIILLFLGISMSSINISSNQNQRKRTMMTKSKLEFNRSFSFFFLRFTNSFRKKSKIPWISARNAVLAVLRDGSEFIVAVHCLPDGYLWSSNLTLIQYGMFGTCSALIRLLILFKFEN